MIFWVDEISSLATNLFELVKEEFNVGVGDGAREIFDRSEEVRDSTISIIALIPVMKSVLGLCSERFVDGFEYLFMTRAEKVDESGQPWLTPFFIAIAFQDEVSHLK